MIAFRSRSDLALSGMAAMPTPSTTVPITVMAQTSPNRRFLIAGSAFGIVSDPLPSPSYS